MSSKPFQAFASKIVDIKTPAIMEFQVIRPISYVPPRWEYCYLAPCRFFQPQPHLGPAIAVEVVAAILAAMGQGGNDRAQVIRRFGPNCPPVVACSGKNILSFSARRGHDWRYAWDWRGCGQRGAGGEDGPKGDEQEFDSHAPYYNPAHAPRSPGAGGSPVLAPALAGRLGSGPQRARRANNDASVPQAGCRGRSPRRGYRGSPPVSKTLEGGHGGTTASATISPLSLGTRGQARKCLPPIAKEEQLCYSIPRKWAPGPLLFLGACRITYVLGANHRESPCGRGAEGTPQGARPSEEGWDRSECRCEASSLERDGSITIRYGSITVPLQILYSSIAAPLRLVTPYYAFCYGSMPENPEIRLTNLTTYNQRGRLTCPQRRMQGTRCSTGRCGGKVKKRVPTRQATKRRPILPPSRVQGAQPPPGVQRVPLYSKTMEGGLGGTTTSAAKNPLPSLPRTRGELGSVRTRQAARVGWRRKPKLTHR